jgi:hypothetical protein
MRKYRMALNFEHDEVCIKGKCPNTVIEKVSTICQACWYAMCSPRLGDEWLESRPSAAEPRRKKAPDKQGHNSMENQPPSIKNKLVQMEEIDDVDRHHPRIGLKLSDPSIMESEETCCKEEAGPESDNEEPEESAEFFQEVTQERYPEGPRLWKSRRHSSPP